MIALKSWEKLLFNLSQARDRFLPFGNIGPLELLIIQSSAFCNIDCSYCYLPNRSDKRRMLESTVEKLFYRIFESNLVTNGFTISWHAGEPTAVPIEFYKKAFSIIERVRPKEIAIKHSFQTNATLIDESWCSFLKEHSVAVGVSVDGPEFLHDRYRKTRRGAGTHFQVLEGMRKLKSRGIPFHTISVLTIDSLPYAKEIFNFFVAENIKSVCFNVEEQEDNHARSSLSSTGVQELFRNFMRSFYQLVIEQQPDMRVRELDGALAAIQTWGKDFKVGSAKFGQQLDPYRIISVDVDGNFSTYSPELLGASTNEGVNFFLGNVNSVSFSEAIKTEKFRTFYTEIRAGIRRCRHECGYFEGCGGGSPSNKFFENGTFDSSQTMFCNLHRKIVIDTVLEGIEKPFSRSALSDNDIPD